jgi:hypothetical protein
MAAKMTLKEYLKQQERYLQEQRESWEIMHIERIKALLLEPPFSFSEEKATTSAKEMIRIQGYELLFNADDDDSKAQVESIYDIRTDCVNNLQYSVAVLFINAPTKKYGLNYEDDEKSRDLQYKNFIELHPDLKQEDPKIYKRDQKVIDYDTMKKYIQEFLKGEGSKSFLASIFFNGHGSKEGLHLHNEEKDIPLDIAITDIRHNWEKIRSDLGLPKKLQIIFAQCYAHLHKPPDVENFEVHAFTKDGHEKTIVSLERDPLTNSPAIAHHNELEESAMCPNPSWAQAHEEHDVLKSMRPEPGPSTAMGGVKQVLEEMNELDVNAQDEQPACGDAAEMDG